MQDEHGEEYIIEYRQVGAQVRVTAIDPVSHTEASIIGPLSAGQHDLGKLAVRKLKYVLAKQAQHPTD